MTRIPPNEVNPLLEGTEPLTIEDKAKFAYFGVNAKILPPFRFLNPQQISIGDRVSIRDGCHIDAFKDLTFNHDYVEPLFRGDCGRDEYIYDGRIVIDHSWQIGRFAFMSCTKSITSEPLV